MHLHSESLTSLKNPPPTKTSIFTDLPTDLPTYLSESHTFHRKDSPSEDLSNNASSIAEAEAIGEGTESSLSEHEHEHDVGDGSAKLETEAENETTVLGDAPQTLDTETF